MDLLKLKQFEGVAASATATLVTNELAGRSLYALYLVRGGTTFTAAQISGFRARVNGKDVIPSGLTGAQLEDMNDYDGISVVTNYSPFYFGDPTARTIRGQHLGDFDFDIYNAPLEIEVAIGAATGPTLRALALVGPPKAGMGIGFSNGEAAAFRTLVRSVLSPSAAVTRQAQQLSIGSGPGALLRKVHLFHTNLTSVEFTKQSLRKWDDINDADNDAIQTQHARVPQSGLYVLDRIFDGNIGEAEPTLQQDGRPWNLGLNLTTSAADTITAYADALLNHAIL